jgi:hypothetical protein
MPQDNSNPHRDAGGYFNLHVLGMVSMVYVETPASFTSAYMFSVQCALDLWNP